MKDHAEKRLGRRGSREAIDWINAVQQLEGSICPHQFECMQLFALILTDRPALGIYGGGLARCLQLFSSSSTNKAQRCHTNLFPQNPIHRLWSSSTRSVGLAIIPIPKNGLLKLRYLDGLMVNHQLALRKSNLHSCSAYGHPCTTCTVN